VGREGADSLGGRHLASKSSSNDPRRRLNLSI
jgi:hypothetical protein